MSESQPANIFETQNVDLASFLIMEGVELLNFVRDPVNSRIVVMRFIDDDRKCINLEQVYLSSDYKRFRDINKYLLSKVHAKVREG